MADVDLPIKVGGAGGSASDPKIRGAGLKKIFQPFGSQFGPKITGEWTPRAPSLDPPLRCSYQKSICISTNYCTLQISSHP